MVIVSYYKYMNNDNYQLPLHNPWWEAGVDIDNDIKLRELAERKFQYKHPLLDEFPINKSVILTLRGPRQIGKTTLLKQIIRKLIKKNITRKNISFFPCDMISNFKELYSILNEYIQERRVESKTHLFIFIDEISFVDQWQRAIKSLADEGSLTNASVLITGSNSIDLKTSSERLPGRTGKYFNTDKLFLPLDFIEFYKLTNKEWDGEFHHKDVPRFIKYFNDYLLVGGFPNVINEYYEKGFISPETYETYIKWIDGDIYKNGKSPENAYKLFKQLDKSIASRISYTALAQNSGLASQKTVQEYLEMFEMMFVIYRCDYFSLEQKKTDSKKNKKVYFLDPFIHNAVISRENGFLDDAFDYSKKILLATKNIPVRFEEVIGAYLRKKYVKLFYGSYGKNNLELDFVGFKKGEYDLFEAKHGNSQNIFDYSNLMDKLSGYNKLTIITKNYEKEEEQIELVPFYKFFKT